MGGGNKCMKAKQCAEGVRLLWSLMGQTIVNFHSRHGQFMMNCASSKTKGDSSGGSLREKKMITAIHSDSDTIKLFNFYKMIHVKIGEPSYRWDTVGKTIYVLDALMLTNYKQYNTIVVNEAHKYPNLLVFANLCKKANVNLKIGGFLNENTMKVLDIADKFEKCTE